MKAAALFAALAAAILLTPLLTPAAEAGAATGAPLSFLAPYADYGCYGRCLVRQIEMHRRLEARWAADRRGEHRPAAAWR